MMAMSFWVYILKCSDNSYYTGHTDNLERRLNQHQMRHFPTCYTASRLPLELVFSQPFGSRAEALASERQIKGWSRKKKEAMIQSDWAEVSRLARNTLRQAQGDRSMRLAQGDQNKD
ncbi:GIY-YIG nuclease family protein [Zhongshania sp.]|jgi:predicted GIY-YIG superfamily endonuclease|uniref:GIY-YIG nuclease family protein n=1 Tax=Zhongshania sp. TaxID=1971902 RepID=UPI0039C62F3C